MYFTPVELADFLREADQEWTQTRAVDMRRAVGGGEPDGRLGVVTGKPLAGGKGTPGSPCPYCGEIDGHTGQCSVVS